MMLRDLLAYAVVGAPTGDIATLDEILGFYETWYNLTDTPLEDLHLSRLDLEEQERDYLSIGGQKL